jgi:flagellar basal-body rod protein FlgG
MNEILAVTLQGMQGDAARVEQIAANLTNSLTVGYKRGVILQSPMGTNFSAHWNSANVAQVREASAVPLALRTDERPGTLKSTGQSLDFSIAGAGYFEVLTGRGPAYTRLGNFRLDASGRLVTAQGYPVMGQAGEIVLTQSNPVITANGAVLPVDGNEDAPIAHLKVVVFDDAGAGPRVGEGLLAGGTSMTVLRPEQIQVRQGFVENSNVVPTTEMAALIQAMRHFEAMQKVAQGYDEMLGGAIRKLGDAS